MDAEDTTQWPVYTDTGSVADWAEATESQGSVAHPDPGGSIVTGDVAAASEAQVAEPGQPVRHSAHR